jgi:SAM-dependent methyltransferase
MSFRSIFRKLRSSQIQHQAFNSENEVKAQDIVDYWIDLKPHMAERPYVHQHAERFSKTINLLDARRVVANQVLDIAGNEVSQHIFSKFLNCSRYIITPKEFDIEVGPWEGMFEEGSFDLVIFTEVIEHLSADPALVIHWSNRLLKDGGILLLSTPNISSSLGLYNLAHGRAPYHWGVLFGTRQDRHHREYAPWELAELVSVHGFDTELSTKDCYEKGEASQLASAWLRQQLPETDARLRGDTIFICASKVEQSSQTIWLEPIYDSSVARPRDGQIVNCFSRIRLI